MASSQASSHGRAESSSSRYSGYEQASYTTPKASSNRPRRNDKQLSAKQLDKIVKNLSAVQKRVGHFRSDSLGSLPNIHEKSADISPDDIMLGEDGHREVASYVAGSTDSDLVSIQALSNLDLNQSIDQETQIWLQRRGVDQSLVKGFGRGPDGLALAKVAAKAYKGKANAPQDAFLHEASFVFNPLMQRVPPPSPRKQNTAKVPQNHYTTHRNDHPRLFQRKEALDKDIVGGQTESKPSTSNVPMQDLDDPDDFAHAPKEVQEALILEDLLFVLLDIEGRYIHYAANYSPDSLGSRLKGANFVVDQALDPSLRDLTQRIIPLGTYYSSIFSFVEAESSLEYGTVIHALCASLRKLLKEYQVLIVQLEHQLKVSPEFTLQRLWFYIYPTLRTFALARDFLTEIMEISHANVIESDDENEDASSAEDEDEVGSETDSLDRRRRDLLRYEESEDAGIVGGVVRGGEVLSMLWDRVVKMGGDETAHKLFSTLLHDASQPYSRILLRWISTGHLSDTYDEFLVMENPRVSRASLESDPTDEYWERRYMLRDEAALAQKEHERQQGLDLDSIVEENGSRGILTGGAKIPAFLEPWKRKILLAGKYLNVIRECGREVPHDEAVQLHEMQDINIIEEAFYQQVESAYQYANRALLSLLLHEQNIIPRLRSMKHYFFLSQSDFFSSFLEAAGRELRKEVVADKVRDVTIMRLQSHLGMVLGSSNCIGFEDPFREDIRVQLATENAYDQLKRIAEIRGGIEAARAQAKLARQKDKDRISLLELLQFDLTVKFPVSLVISKKNILRWQFLQRPILHLKSTEKVLCDLWMEHQDTAWRSVERHHPQLQQWKMRIFRLRHRILFFVQQVLAFVTAEVIEPNWHELEIKMEQATTVDEFLKDHFDFLNICRKECMLTDLRYVEMMSKLMSVAVIFCENRVRFRDQLFMERESAQDGQNAPKLHEEVSSFLSRIEAHWEKRLRTFKDIVALLSTTDNPAALPLSYRLQSA